MSIKVMTGNACYLLQRHRDEEAIAILDEVLSTVPSAMDTGAIDQALRLILTRQGLPGLRWLAEKVNILGFIKNDVLWEALKVASDPEAVNLLFAIIDRVKPDGGEILNHAFFLKGSSDESMVQGLSHYWKNPRLLFDMSQSPGRVWKACVDFSHHKAIAHLERKKIYCVDGREEIFNNLCTALYNEDFRAFDALFTMQKPTGWFAEKVGIDGMWSLKKRKLETGFDKNRLMNETFMGHLVERVTACNSAYERDYLERFPRQISFLASRGAQTFGGKIFDALMDACSELPSRSKHSEGRAVKVMGILDKIKRGESMKSNIFLPASPSGLSL